MATLDSCPVRPRRRRSTAAPYVPHGSGCSEFILGCIVAGVTALTMSLDTLERVGTALADPTRRQILVQLLDGAAYPADLADSIGVGRSNISNHLACLRGCGLVRSEREAGRCATSSPRLAWCTRCATSSIWSSTSTPITRISMAVTDHGHAHDTAAATAAPPSRDDAVRRARHLNVATIAWNGTEGVVAVLAGVAAGSVSLVGFGFDSAIEVSAALILAWRLQRERRGGCMQADDHPPPAPSP